MALTRKYLESIGIESAQVEAIIEAHTETVNALKAARDGFKEEAEKVPDLLKQLEDAASQAADNEGWREKYEAEHKAYKDFQTKVDGERTEAAKAKAYRGMLKEAGIDPKRLDSIMRVTDLSKVEIDDGKLKGADKLKESAKTEWADFVLKTKTVGSNPETPPAKSVADGGDTEVAKRMQERHEQKYGKAPETKE